MCAERRGRSVNLRPISAFACPLTPLTLLPPLGFGLGAFFSLMSSSFAYEDPLSRANEKLVGTRAQTAFIFKEMGRNMWKSGKGFGKVGALYSGTECCVEGVSWGESPCVHLTRG